MGYVLYQKMNTNPPEGKVKVPAVKQFGNEVKPAEELSALEYDISKWKEQLQQLVIGCGMISLMHFKHEYILPLPLQCVMVPMNFFDCQLVKIYLYGQPAQGKLSRPFPAANPFGLPSNGDDEKE